jgi:hypothetical protein
MVGSRRGQGCVEDVVSAQRYGAEAAAQQVEREGHPRGEKRRVKGVEDGKEATTEGDRGAGALFIPGPSGEGRVARSGGARPEAAAHRHRFYRGNSKTDQSSPLVKYDLCK